MTDFEKIYLYPNSHAGYYPGAKMLAIKVLFRKSDGRLLGRPGARRGLACPNESTRLRWPSRWVARSTTWKSPNSAMRPVRQREGSGQLRRNGRRGYPAGRHATLPLEFGEHGFLLDVRNPPELAVESIPAR